MTSKCLQVDFWNVGQGDASSILIEESNERIVLDVIDVGPSRNQFVAWICSPRSKRIIIRNLILTHNDGDHVDGLVSILKERNVTIERALILEDRATVFPQNSAIGMLLSLHRDIISRLERDGEERVLDAFGDYRLTVAYPKAVDNMFSKGKPNDTSAIIHLFHTDPEGAAKTLLITWAADNKLRTVMNNTPPGTRMLFGPHHGGPQDRRCDKYSHYVSMISPGKCFLSFATVNAYAHPKKKYIKSLVENNCGVICAQCARECGKDRETPVLDGDGFYSLLVPNGNGRSVACHGHVRLQIDGSDVKDELAEEYAEAKKEVSDALCSPGGWPS